MADLNSGLIVSAMMRLANRAGGFAALVHRGDDAAGAILLIALEKGAIAGVYEQILNRDGRYIWTAVGPQTIEKQEEISEYLQRRHARDPDLWVVELDIPDSARFIAELPVRT